MTNYSHEIKFLIKELATVLGKLGICGKRNYGVILLDKEAKKIISIGFTTSVEIAKSIVSWNINPNNIWDIINSKDYEIVIKGKSWKVIITRSSEDNQISIEGDFPKNIVPGKCKILGDINCPRLSAPYPVYYNCPSVHAEQLALYVTRNDPLGSIMLIAQVVNKEFRYSGPKAYCTECSYLLENLNITAAWLSERDNIIVKRPGDYSRDISSLYSRFVKDNKLTIEEYFLELQTLVRKVPKFARDKVLEKASFYLELLKRYGLGQDININI